MKTFLTNIFSFGLIGFMFFISSCSSQSSNTPKENENKTEVKPTKNAYELASEFVNKLRNEKTDTILFYGRVCINCCDFFNIFWSAKGQRYVRKFYFGDRHANSETIDMTHNPIFEVVHTNFNELKNTSIKPNRHIYKNGRSIELIVDHYCYVEIRIYTKNDSIITRTMKDHDFDTYLDYQSDPSDKRISNDNYRKNLNSKWNLLLTAIENKILRMPETSKREIETLRTTRPGK